MAKGAGTFCRSVGSRVSYGDASGRTPKKLKEDGDLPMFTTNYRPYGGRERPNDVTPGAPDMRARNRYGKNERSENDGIGMTGIGMFGLFGR